MAIINDGGGSSKPKTNYSPPPPKPSTTSNSGSTSSTSSSTSTSSTSSTKPKEHEPDEGVDNTPSTTTTTETNDDAFDWSPEAQDAAGTNETAETGETTETAETGPPDFNTMTQQEQYDYFHNLVVQQAGGDESAWKSGEGEVNIVGIRSYTDGQPTTPEGNRYNDTIYVIRTVNGEPVVEAFHSSTDGGVFTDPQASGFGYSANGEYKGISHLADGFYRDTWVKGGVPATDLGGLRQNADIQIHADSNNDGVIQDNERLGTNGEGVTVGAGWGIQFHPGGNGENVGSWSAGCQVIRGSEYAHFAEIIRDAPNQNFSYLLIDGANLPPAGAGHAAAGAGGNQGAGQTGGQGGPTTPAQPNPAAGEPTTPTTPTTPANNTTPAATPTEPAAPVQETPAAEAPAAEPEPYRPQPMPSNMSNRDVNSAVDMQLQALVDQAQWEVENGMKNGPGVTALYEWYKMATTTKLPIAAETKKTVLDILTKAGISVAQPQQAKPMYTFNMGSPLAAFMNPNRQA